jgi:hypothetical protein
MRGFEKFWPLESFKWPLPNFGHVKVRRWSGIRGLFFGYEYFKTSNFHLSKVVDTGPKVEDLLLGVSSVHSNQHPLAMLSLAMLSAPHTGDGVTGAGVTGDAVTGAGVTGDAVTGAGVTGAGVTGDAVTGDAVTGDGVTGDAVTGDAVGTAPFFFFLFDLSSRVRPTTSRSLGVLPSRLGSTCFILRRS